MKIFHARKRFATNSSSSHSIVFFRKRDPENPLQSTCRGNSFGWDFFTLADTKTKQSYLNALLHITLSQRIGKETADLFFAGRPEIERAEDGTLDTGYIDHQSVWLLPHDWNGQGIDRGFWEDFQTFILQDDVVILGGNDNAEEDHPLEDQTKLALPARYPTESSEIFVARKDGNYWTLFSRVTGDKIRLSLDPTSQPPTFATYPELVDLKITDFCPFDCNYCYQGSTRKGGHAPLTKLDEIAYGLSTVKVFEVALGGGEPTLHPEFIEILKAMRSHKIVPNFTTKNFAFFADSNKVVRDEALSLCGAVAVSVETSADIAKLRDLIKAGSIASKKIVLQHVMGLDQSEDEFRLFMMTVIEPLLNAEGREIWPARDLTLLGYKTTGRGINITPTEVSPWIEIVKQAQAAARWPKLNVAIDTVLAHKFYDQLRTAGVDDVFLGRRDGQFSLYVDAVEGFVAPSSYEVGADQRAKFSRWNLADKLKETLLRANNP